MIEHNVGRFIRESRNCHLHDWFREAQFGREKDFEHREGFCFPAGGNELASLFVD